MTHYIGKLILLNNREYLIIGVHSRLEFFIAHELGRNSEFLIGFDEIN